ncbi:MAG TPA: GAF domain-containing sensor histidine kinase [Actinomycetota bacterium]|nr:GAF domain-containing sensor histidine kinase [Actinomycetota bacterium]
MAWSVGIVSIVLMIAGLVLMFVDRGSDLPNDVATWSASDVLGVFVSLGVPVLGVVIVNKRPRNAIGWVFIVAGTALALVTFGQVYALHVLRADPGSLPAGRVLAWLSNVLWPIPLAALILLFLLFPTGRLPSPRWRPVLWLVMVILLVLSLGALILATAGWSQPFAGIDVSAGSVGAVAKTVIVIAVLAEIIALLLSVASLVVRFRRSTGEERLQLKWFVSAAAVAAVAFIVGIFIDAPFVSVLVSISLMFLYVAIGIAMLKHNLYDIDLIINKTITYGAIAAFITAIYVIVVVVIGALIGVTEGVSLLATAVVAVAFQPIRRRAQQFANRLVYGERATPYEVLSRFSEHVGETYSGEDILVRMARLLAEGTGATSAVVWLRVGDEVRPAATWPTNGAIATAIPLAAGEPPVVDGATVSIPVRHQRELLGLLTVTKPPSEPLSPVEEKLVVDLAGQTGLVLANSRLIEDLRASRQRLVAAQDAERRRLERNLHDGAQQQLVALAVRLRLARTTASKDLAEADRMLEQLEGDVTRALENLRELARGVYPPLLADRGLVAAIEAQARRSPVPVHVEADGIGRYQQELETAVYFCTLEALQNAAKYAQANEVAVSLLEDQGELVLSIRDDGRGFDRAETPFGAGLQNMADRLAALGGTLSVRSRPGAGTTIEGRVPVRSE